MQQLHLVGFTADHEGLIFSARKGAKSGGFVVTVDERLLERIQEAVAFRNGTSREQRPRKAGQPRLTFEIPKPPRPQSSLTPREMQSRLRAGHSVSEVAEEAGVDEEWVARFAAPVLAEQAQVVERAGRMVYSKPRLGESSMPLRDAVARNLVDKGIVLPEDKFDQAWSAYQQRDGTWIVRFQYVSRKHSQRAEWIADFQERVLLAHNRLASELGYVEKGRSRRGVPFLPPAEPEPVPAAEMAADDGEEAGEPTRRRGRGTRAPGRAGRRPVTRRATGRRGRTAKKAAAKKTTARKAAGRMAKTAGRSTKAAGRTAKAAGRTAKAAVKKTAVKKTAAKKASGRAAKAGRSTRATAKKSGRPAAKAARRGPAKKATPKKAVAKKAVAKRTVVKKTVAKKAPKKAPRKVAARTTSARSVRAAAPRLPVASQGPGRARAERPLRVRPLVAPGRAAPSGPGVMAMTVTGARHVSGSASGVAYAAPEAQPLSGAPAVGGPAVVIRAPVASSGFPRSM